VSEHHAVELLFNELGRLAAQDDLPTAPMSLELVDLFARVAR
jgi:hypothetical protein